MLLRCAAASSPVLEDLPPIGLKLAGELISDGTEHALNTRSSTLILRLSGDTWRTNAGSTGNHLAAQSRAAVLTSFESLHPHEPAGWTAVVAPAFNASLDISRISDTEIQLQLPRLRCYDLLYPEVVMVRLPGVATVVGAGEGLCTPVAVVVPEDAALTAI